MNDNNELEKKFANTSFQKYIESLDIETIASNSSFVKDIIINEFRRRIIKAIDYIESYLPNYDFDHYNLKKILEILRGDDDV